MNVIDFYLKMKENGITKKDDIDFILKWYKEGYLSKDQVASTIETYSHKELTQEEVRTLILALDEVIFNQENSRVNNFGNRTITIKSTINESFQNWVSGIHAKALNGFIPWLQEVAKPFLGEKVNPHKLHVYTGINYSSCRSYFRAGSLPTYNMALRIAKSFQTNLESFCEYIGEKSIKAETLFEIIGCAERKKYSKLP